MKRELAAMNDAFLQTDAGWTHPRGHAMSDAGYLQWQESPFTSIPKLPQIEVANIEIAALADLYQQQLAEICAEHSLLLEDQSKLAKLIAPFLDEHGYVTGEFSETVLLLKQGLDLRLLEYEEDCRRIQQTERRLQRRIDDILVNYELLALEAQGLAESRLTEQVNNMRRIICVLQSELDEARFQRDVYADETRRLRGICRFGHWIEDGYGVSGVDADEVRPLVEGRSHGTAHTSPLTAVDSAVPLQQSITPALHFFSWRTSCSPSATVRQPRQTQLPSTCIKAIQRALRTDDSITQQHAEAIGVKKDTDETRGGRHPSRTMESDLSEQYEGNRKAGETEGRKASEPSLFQEVLAKLLGGPEGTKSSPAQKRNMPVTVKAVRRGDSETSLPQVCVAAKGPHWERTNGKQTTTVRRLRAATMEEGRTEHQRHEETQLQRRRARSPEDVRRDVPAASRDSNVTVERARPVYRSRTVSEEQRFMGYDVQNQRKAEKTGVARSRSSDASEGETTKKGPDAFTSRKSSATIEKGPLRTREEYVGDNRKNHSALGNKEDREKAGATTFAHPTREALLRQTATCSLSDWGPAVQETEPRRYAPPRRESEVSQRRPGSAKEENSIVALSPRTSSPSDHEELSRELTQAAGGPEFASITDLEKPLRGSDTSVYQRRSRAKQPDGTREEFPRRFKSRTLASPRLSKGPAAPFSEDQPSEPEPTEEAGTADHDLLIPAWRRTRTMSSPIPRRYVDSAPQSPRVSGVGDERGSVSSVGPHSQENPSTRWHRKEEQFEKGGTPARGTSAALREGSDEIYVPHSDRPWRSDSRPRIMSPVSGCSSVLEGTRRLASPRSFGRATSSGAVAASLEFRPRERTCGHAESAFSQNDDILHGFVNGDAEEH